MAIGKRIFLVIITNILIVVSISIILKVLGLQTYLTANGLDYQSLAAFCLLWGFGGAFVSLALSREMAKWLLKVNVVAPTSATREDRWLVDTVTRLSSQAGLPKVPEVGIYDSDEPNAFATGPTKSKALIAVSKGLLNKMSRAEAEGVLAHEVAHVANGDMVTMTLVQGLVNAFVMFFARMIAWSLSQFFDEERRGIVNFFAVMVFEIAFSFLAIIVVSSFSRRREYRADGGGANLVGRQKMIAALKSLQRAVHVESEVPQSIAALKISSTKRSGLMSLISTHPPLEERIKRLQAA